MRRKQSALMYLVGGAEKGNKKKVREIVKREEQRGEELRHGQPERKT